MYSWRLETEHHERDHQHADHDSRVAEGPAQFGHVVGSPGEVHAVDADDEGERDEKGRDTVSTFITSLVDCEREVTVTENARPG
jgi:hypothetical protein